MVCGGEWINKVLKVDVYIYLAVRNEGKGEKVLMEYKSWNWRGGGVRTSLSAWSRFICKGVYCSSIAVYPCLMKMLVRLKKENDCVNGMLHGLVNSLYRNNA